VKVVDFLRSFEQKKEMKHLIFAKFTTTTKKNHCCKQNHKQEYMKYETFSAMKSLKQTFEMTYKKNFNKSVKCFKRRLQNVLSKP
jgi:hypothetical protein